MSRSLAIALAGCGAAAPAPIAPASEPDFAITDTAIGPITATTPASLVALRAAMPRYEVAPAHTGDRLEYRVFDHGKQLFAVVPEPATGLVRDVQIATTRVVAKHGWRTGGTLADGDLVTGCECVDHIALCYVSGEHVAVAFARSCEKLRRIQKRRMFQGATIDHLVWRPRPFGEVAEPDPGEDEPVD
ncbi:MAG: hypothetical protein ABI867_43560 [Kofleriaceae bacterium]